MMLLKTNRIFSFSSIMLSSMHDFSLCTLGFTSIWLKFKANNKEKKIQQFQPKDAEIIYDIKKTFNVTTLCFCTWHISSHLFISFSLECMKKKTTRRESSKKKHVRASFKIATWNI